MPQGETEQEAIKLSALQKDNVLHRSSYSWRQILLPFFEGEKYIQNYGNCPNYLKTCYRGRGAMKDGETSFHTLPYASKRLIIVW